MRAGFTVRLEDVMPANLHHAQEYLRQQLGPSAMPSVGFVSTIEEAVREADLAIDCVPDELESKLEIFCLLDRMAPPRTVLMTPTRNLSIADLASCTYRAEQCVAIVADTRELALETDSELSQTHSRAEILLRIPPQASETTLESARKFWEGLGLSPRFEIDQAA